MVKLHRGHFMTKQLNKTIMDRAKLVDRYMKKPLRENFLYYKRVKNTCNNLNKFIKSYFDKVSKFSKGF